MEESSAKLSLSLSPSLDSFFFPSPVVFIGRQNAVRSWVEITT